jgi:hypothetical protein
MKNKAPGFAVIAAFAIVLSSCSKLSDLDQSRPSIAVANVEQSMDQLLLLVNTDGYLTVEEGWTITHSELPPNPPGSIQSWSVGRMLYLKCLAKGQGVLTFDVKGPDNLRDTFNFLVRCVDGFIPRMNEPVNLTAHFAGQGLTVVGISVQPTDLAEQVDIGANLSLPNRSSAAGALTLSGTAIHGSDIGVSCLHPGEGTLTVSFTSGSNGYELICVPAHDQGGGN